MKALLRGMFITPIAYINKWERSHTINVTAHPKALEQMEESHPKGEDHHK